MLSIVRYILAVYQTHDLTMVLTATQTTAFFEHANQMGIPHVTVVQLQAEGITSVSDLADFNKDSLQQLADNLIRPGGRVPDPNPTAQPGSTIPTPPFVFGAKSQRRIAVACDLVNYYRTFGHDLTAANLQWNTVMKNFDVQWTALKEKRGEDSPETPKISKALPVIKWTEAFQDFLNRKIGNRNIPLAYIIRDEPNPPAVAPPLAPGQPHSIEHGSVEAELIARASHTHALFQNDNSDLYFLLEEATQSTPYAASIKPFQRNRDGEGAWKALTSQYAGKANGRLKSRSKNNYCIHISGKDKATSRLNISSPNIATHMYQCQPVQNTSNISYLMNTLVLAFKLMRSNVPMQDYRLQWPVSRQTMAHMVCGTILREPCHIYYHMTQWPRSRLQVSNEV